MIDRFGVMTFGITGFGPTIFRLMRFRAMMVGQMGFGISLCPREDSPLSISAVGLSHSVDLKQTRNLNDKCSVQAEY